MWEFVSLLGAIVASVFLLIFLYVGVMTSVTLIRQAFKQK